MSRLQCQLKHDYLLADLLKTDVFDSHCHLMYIHLLWWHYSPMWTCTSLMDYSQSALCSDLSFWFVNLHWLLSVCTQDYMSMAITITCCGNNVTMAAWNLHPCVLQKYLKAQEETTLHLLNLSYSLGWPEVAQKFYLFSISGVVCLCLLLFLILQHLVQSQGTQII